MSSQLENHPTPPQRILVVDDEPGIVFMLKTKLDLAGFEVLTASDGVHALSVIDEHGIPHLAVVDIIMPRMGGLEFCRALREFSDVPIIMLTSVDDEDIMVDAIEEFAEDYITKPFRPKELVARIRRVLGRFESFSYTRDPVLSIDARLSLDLAHQRVFVNENPVGLSSTETKLLYILTQQMGKVLSGEYIQRRLWPNGAVVEGTLRLNIYRIRQKIEPSPGNPIYLLTHRGKGYSFTDREFV